MTDAEGLKLFDVTRLAEPSRCPSATVPLADARKLYLARTYAYVAAKQEGLVIVDVTHPERRRVYRKVTFDGRMNDVEDVIVASTNASLFAYVADGRNGMKVLQLTSPASQPNFYGFSPAPMPELIAWARTPLARAGAVQGPRPRPRRRRDRRPDRRLRPPRLAPVHAGRDGAAVPQQPGLPYKVSDTGTMQDWVPAGGQVRRPRARRQAQRRRRVSG